MLLVGWLIVVLVAAPVLLTCATYCTRRRSGGDARAAPTPPAAAACGVLIECAAAGATTIAWPFRLRRALPRGVPVRRVAVLVPDVGMRSGTLWYLFRRLDALGWPCVAGAQGVLPGRRAALFASLDACIGAVAAPDREVVLIAHGLSGLLVRQYLAERPSLAIRRLVTIGTPHQGSRAFLYRALGASDLAALGRLAGARGGPAVEIIAVHSDFDAWLVPVDGAYCPGAFNINVRGLGHFRMVLSGRVVDLIAENLAAP